MQVGDKVKIKTTNEIGRVVSKNNLTKTVSIDTGEKIYTDLSDNGSMEVISDETLYDRFCESFPYHPRSTGGYPRVKPCDLQDMKCLFPCMHHRCWENHGFVQTSVCGECEYFDEEHEKCISPNSEASATKAESKACENFQEF